MNAERHCLVQIAQQFSFISSGMEIVYLGLEEASQGKRLRDMQWNLRRPLTMLMPPTGFTNKASS